MYPNPERIHRSTTAFSSRNDKKKYKMKCIKITVDFKGRNLCCMCTNHKYTVSQGLLGLQTQFLCDVFFNVCKHPSPYEITSCRHSIPVRELSISENRHCRSHRCPADTNEVHNQKLSPLPWVCDNS